jgi:hypothetical protein
MSTGLAVRGAWFWFGIQEAAAGHTEPNKLWGFCHVSALTRMRRGLTFRFAYF